MQQLTSRNQILDWLFAHDKAIRSRRKYLIRYDDTDNTWYVSVNGDLSLVYADITCIPFRLDFIHGSFNAQHTKISNVSDLPAHVFGSLGISHTKITSLHNIHHFVQSCHTFVSGSDHVTHLLGLFSIERLNRVITIENDTMEIINRHLPSRNMLACQEELIDAGYVECAKL